MCSTTTTSASITSAYVKEKSPMCLINDLCRCNDTKQEYHLIDESGPPHEKTFTVVLKIGEEEYRASGQSIKKAQRSAALLALKNTKLRNPSPKMSRSLNRSSWPLTPTVELNVLAMKLGEAVEYRVYEPPRPQHTQPFHFGPLGAHSGAASAYDFRGMHYQRYHMPRGPYNATLAVGSRQFVGKGGTAQAARHAAAQEALKVLRELPIPVTTTNGDTETEEGNDECHKSPISLVHETALKRCLSVKFEVVSESGPSHMPKFVTQCIVGDIATTGEGNGKKVSKKSAAIKMLEELKKLEPLPPKCDDADVKLNANQRQRMQRKPKFIKKKRNNNIIKDIVNNCEQTSQQSQTTHDEKNGDVNAVNDSEVQNNTGNASESLTIHPINRLIQLQQAKKEKDPQFTVIEERKDRKHKEFHIECTISIMKGPNAPNVLRSVGIGRNKKIAKKNAAETMLQQLGYSSKPSHPQSILKQDSFEGQQQTQQQQMQKKIRQVKFVDDKQQLVDVLANVQPNRIGRQLAPGLILMPTNTDVNCSHKSNASVTGSSDSAVSGVDSYYSVEQRFDNKC